MDAIDLGAEVADIREELAELQTRIERVVGQAARHLPGGDHLYHRIEAYPGLRFDRDMGAGVGPDGWLQEIEEFFEGVPATG
jgi:hypothetical protein